MTIDQILDKYGFPGAAIAVLGWFVLFLYKSAQKERKEWKESTDKLTDKMIDAFEKNTNALQAIKTILDSKK